MKRVKILTFVFVSAIAMVFCASESVLAKSGKMKCDLHGSAHNMGKSLNHAALTAGEADHHHPANTLSQAFYKLQANKNIGYPDDWRKFLDFKRFEKDCGDFVLLEGYFEEAHQWEQFGFSKKELKNILKQRLIRLDFDEPSKFNIGDNPDNYDHYFDKIFTICPYTAEWLNKRQDNMKRILVCYPTNEKYIPKKTKKIYDIIYVGNIVAKNIRNDIDTISKFDYRLVSFSNDKLVTDRGVSHKKKLKLISQSKIALVHNLLFVRPYHVYYIWRAKDWKNNEAFKLIPRWHDFWKIFTNKNILIPQTKSRLFESALCRSLILCKKDPFNVIEYFFEPNKDFIYYEEGELEQKVKSILKNYDKYQSVIENAYNKALNNYTTKTFVKLHLSKM